MSGVSGDQIEIDLDVLLWAMDAIATRPQDFSYAEISAAMILAARIVLRFAMLHGATFSEILRAELKDAEPKGRA